MRDEDFDYFIEKFGEATHKQDVSAAALARWKGVLPDQLLHYWRTEGWCGYADGLFWTVDPEEYEDVVDAWLDGTELAGIDRFHAISRTAFGSLYLCGEKTGPKVELVCPVNAIVFLERDLKSKTEDDLDFEIRGHFSGHDQEDCNIKDEDRKHLFHRAFKKLGPLGPDEIYGFEPAIVAGGRMRLENLRKVKAHAHLMILRDLAPPSIPFQNVDPGDLSV